LGFFGGKSKELNYTKSLKMVFQTINQRKKKIKTSGPNSKQGNAQHAEEFQRE